MPPSPTERCASLADPRVGSRRDGSRHGLAALLASLALATAPVQAQAAAPPDPNAEVDPDAQPEADAEAEAEVDPSASEPSESEWAPEPEVTEVERREGPSGAGLAGAVVDPDDPNAARAQSDLEGESLDMDTVGVPERLPKLQAAGWWGTFTAIALATSGGIFAGIAEVREDEAERLAYSFDLSTGRTTTYGPVAADYQRLLDEGHRYQWVARGLIIAGGVALVAGITLFAVDGVRRRKAGPNAAARIRVDPGAGGLTLRF